MKKINRVEVGNKFTFGYTDYVIEVTAIWLIRFQTGEVDTRIQYIDDLNQQGTLSSSMFIEFLDGAGAARIGT